MRNSYLFNQHQQNNSHFKKSFSRILFLPFYKLLVFICRNAIIHQQSIKTFSQLAQSKRRIPSREKIPRTRVKKAQDFSTLASAR